MTISRLQSFVLANIALMLRCANWLTLLSRTFPIELALVGTARISVECSDYVVNEPSSTIRTFTCESNGIMGCRTKADTAKRHGARVPGALTQSNPPRGAVR